jgi:hypothetical protein
MGDTAESSHTFCGICELVRLSRTAAWPRGLHTLSLRQPVGFTTLFAAPHILQGNKFGTAHEIRRNSDFLFRDTNEYSSGRRRAKSFFIICGPARIVWWNENKDCRAVKHTHIVLLGIRKAQSSLLKYRRLCAGEIITYLMRRPKILSPAGVPCAYQTCMAARECFLCAPQTPA